MRSTCLVLFSFLAFSSAHGASSPGSLRSLSGSVGVVDRADAEIAPYLDRLEAALWLERVRTTAGPYVVSIANSIEALDEKDRAGRGERLLLEAYLLLSQFSGPQGARLMQLYAAGLAQLVGAKPDEVTVTEALRNDLQKIGSYAAAAATRLLARQPKAAQPALRTELLLATGKYGPAAREAKSWSQLDPSALARAQFLGAQLLSGQARAAAPLRELEREGGPVGIAAAQFLRRAAREALVSRLGRTLSGAAVSADIRAAALAWGKPEEPPVRDACLALLKQPGESAPLTDCLVLLLESSGSDWAQSGVLAKEENAPAKEPPARRLQLRLATQLGVLLGLPGQRPASDAGARARALEEVIRLLPKIPLPDEDAEALVLLAQIGAAQRPEVPAHLYPAIDKFLKTHSCSPFGLPLLLARHAPPQRAAALSGALSRCTERGPRGDETRRQLALQRLAVDAAGPPAEAAWTVLETLAREQGGKAGAGRFLLSLADAEALRLLARPGGAQDALALEALQRHYEEAAVALLPWDGVEARGRAELQVAALILRRAQLVSLDVPLVVARGHLRFALLLPPGEEALLAQSTYEALELEMLQRSKKTVPAPVDDISRLPSGVGRRALACQLAARAQAARSGPASARYATMAGPPLPEVVTLGQVRLTTSLGIDERLRVGTRGEIGVVLVSRCPVTPSPPPMAVPPARK